MAVPTADQIVALAPDAASVKAGRELATPRRWPLLGGDEGTLWGHAQGSGATPYQVVVLLDELATKCTCPSRKFPCKHGLGLLLLAAQQPAAIPRGEPPAFVTEWLQSRSAREQKQKERAAKKATDVVDEAAQQQRRAKRAQRIDEGIDLLHRWLRDVVRGGLAADGLQKQEAWRAIEQRLVDAQVPGLAARVARVGDRIRLGVSHAAAAMDDLGRLHALLTAAGHRDRLTAEQERSLQQALGVTVPSEEVLAAPGCTDGWFVAARSVFEREHLITIRTWLRGHTSGRWAFVLQSAPAHQRMEEPLPVGTTVHGELCWFPGAVPLRALFRGAPAVRQDPAPAPTNFAEVLRRHAAALVHEPWHGQTPFLVSAQPGERNGELALVDADGEALPTVVRASARTLLSAVTGGRPAPMAGVFDGYHTEPLAVHDGDSWLELAGRVA